MILIKQPISQTFHNSSKCAKRSMEYAVSVSDQLTHDAMQEFSPSLNQALLLLTFSQQLMQHLQLTKCHSLLNI